MTLLEALIALAIATLTITAGLEASRLTGERSALTALEIEAVTMAANAAATVDVNGVTQSQRLQGRDDDKGASWTLDLRPDDAEFGSAAVDITATVRIARGGLVAEKTISDLRLRFDPER